MIMPIPLGVGFFGIYRNFVMNDLSIDNFQYSFDNLKKRILPHTIGGEMLVKAAKPKSLFEKYGYDYNAYILGGVNNTFGNPLPVAVDATAGLGEDSFLLAAAGFRVIMFERDAAIAELLGKMLSDALNDETICNIVKRMELRTEDSITALPNIEVTPDIVLLDPMFPERKKSGLVKKKFQMIHTLEKPCADGAELLEAAMSSGANKIIVKRPAKGPNLADKKPSYTINGSVIRYDVYVM